MAEYTNFVREIMDGELNGVSDEIILAMSMVGALLIVIGIIALIVSIYLAVSYSKFNKKKNSCGLTGEQVARNLLDKHGLSAIKVTCSGSMLFGNSYSHYFKKVRLRRRTWKKDSVASLLMAAQKSSLAVLDKEGDPDMKKRVRLTPLIYIGPIAFVPMIAIGVILDLLIYTANDGMFAIVMSSIGLAFYLMSFVMSLFVLKTEKKAQSKALELMQADGLATQEELEMSLQLFRLYNIEYVNDMLVALLELVYRVLQIIATTQRSGSSTSKS